MLAQIHRLHRFTNLEQPTFIDRRGIPVMVDAAHALGQIPVDLTSLSPDYWVTNCHKWFAGPRGSALMWVAPDRKATLKPLVVSHGSGSGFTSDFIWDGECWVRTFPQMLSRGS